MKYLDQVRLVNDKYKDMDAPKGTKGTILFPELHFGEFEVEFFNEEKNTWPLLSVPVEDLELVKDNGMTDKEILEDLPNNDPKWFCKVEDGYIINLLGERKNKIPYDYNS